MLRDRNFWIGAVVGGAFVYFALPKIMGASAAKGKAPRASSAG